MVHLGNLEELCVAGNIGFICMSVCLGLGVESGHEIGSKSERN